MMPTIVNNYIQPMSTNKETKKTKESNETKVITRAEIVGGMTMFGIVVSTSVYVLTKDECVKFYLSEIDNNMQLLETHAYLYPNIRTIIDNFNLWKTLHRKRTMNTCCVKVVGSSSLLSSITGFMLYSNVMLGGGLFVAIPCGCYLLWKYLTGNMYAENRHYELMVKTINTLIEDIKREINSKIILQSAPPSYDQNPPEYYE